MESDYSPGEDIETLRSFFFTTNQNPFKITLTTVTLDEAESMNLDIFLWFGSYYAFTQARAGTLQLLLYCIFIL